MTQPAQPSEYPLGEPRENLERAIGEARAAVSQGPPLYAELRFVQASRESPTALFHDRREASAVRGWLKGEGLSSTRAWFNAVSTPPAGSVSYAFGVVAHAIVAPSAAERDRAVAILGDLGLILAPIRASRALRGFGAVDLSSSRALDVRLLLLELGYPEGVERPPHWGGTLPAFVELGADIGRMSADGRRRIFCQRHPSTLQLLTPDWPDGLAAEFAGAPYRITAFPSIARSLLRMLDVLQSTLEETSAGEGTKPAPASRVPANGDEPGLPYPEVAIGKSERVVLRAMAAVHGSALLTVTRIAESVPFSDETIGQAVRKFIKHGLAERPNGSRGGARLTIQGLRLAAKIGD